MNEELQLKNRFTELSERSYSRGCYTYTEFLTLAEQDILTKTLPQNRYTLYGGIRDAQRKIACFGNEDICGYEEAPPVSIVKIAPVSMRFADNLTHRDFLGSLMGLGIRREMLGDIITDENTAYLFCLESICAYITENLTQVKHTTVKCTVETELPEICITEPEAQEFVVASERCDAIVAAAYSLSRSNSQKLFSQKLVFINSSLCENPEALLKAEDIVSVRGYGRFIYKGIKLQTKKGKNRILVAVY